MTERYWIHSEPTGWTEGQQPDEEKSCPGRHPADQPAPAEPVWCKPCQAKIKAAIGRLPDLAAQLHALTGEQQDTLDPVQRIAASAPVVRRARHNGHVLDVTIGYTIRLACGHATHRGNHPATDTIECGVCAATSVPQPGRLAAGTGDSDGTRHSTRTGSPSGSPAWDAVDQLISWACRTEDKLRGRLHHSPVERVWWDASTGHRADCLTQACDYLTTWCTALLSSPEATRAGRDVLRLERRAEQATGQDRLTHHLPGPCPACKRRGRLRRDDGDELVQCQACRATWAWDYYQLLAKVYAEAHGGKPRQEVAS